MELKIFSQYGILKLTVSPSASSVWNSELMVENAVSVTFTHPVYLQLDVNDFILLDGIKFSIQKQYKPKQKNEQEYAYTVKFYGPEHDAERVMYLNLTDGQYEPQFSLDGSPREHLQKAVDNLNRIYGEEKWTAGDVLVAPNQTIDYNNTNCWDALAAQAETFETEWWADGYTLNLCRCERGVRTSLGYQQGLTQLTQSENSNDVEFFTRLIPLGSTKNIDSTRYGYTRLQLPGREKFIDLHTDLYGIYDHVEESAFAGIYPHYIGTVSSVRSEEKTGEDKKPFTVYYFKDNGMSFDPSSAEHELGLVKHVSFQSGDLNGRDFETNYNSSTKEWEIINTYPSETVQIPGGNLIPRVGDTYIPWNFRMPVEYEAQAERDYQAAVTDFLSKYSFDTSKYGGDTDYIYVTKNAVPLILGQSVRLLSAQYFGSAGYLDTRMTKVSRKLENLNVATIECTNEVGQGWKKNTDNSISQLQYVVAKQQAETALDILKSWDGREATEYRVMSALRTLSEIKNRALSRLNDDTTSGLITFLQGLVAKGMVNAEEGIKIGQFTTGMLGSGGAITVDSATGKTRIEADELLVRMKAYFYELMIEKFSHVGGQIVLTPAGITCIKVEELPNAYRCYFKSTDDEKTISNDFVIGDQATIREFNIKSTVQDGTNRYYWRLITGIGDDYIDLSKTDCDTNSDVPLAGDEIVQLGNRVDHSRQSAIMLSAFGTDSPSIKQYTGIDAYSLVDKEVTVVSPHGNRFVGDFILSTGTNIATQMKVLENLIKTEVQSIEHWINDEENFLKNASFSLNMDGWKSESALKVFTAEEPLVVNGEYYADAAKIAEVVSHENKYMLRLKDSFVKQLNSDLNHPDKASTFYISFRYLCEATGSLTCGFEGQELYQTVILNPNRQARIFEYSGTWDGTGDFILQFTGDIYISLVTLTNRPLDDFKKEVTSKFEQTATSLRAVVESVDNIDQTIKESGWLTEKDGTKIWASCTFSDGTKAMSLFNVTPEGIFMDGSHINLKGLVTFESFSTDFQTAYQQAFGNASMTAKDDVARQLGYTNYAQLVANAATSGKAIMVGGYLNLNLIDVETLLAEKVISNKIVTSLVGKRIEIDPEQNAILMYNADNREILKIHFEKYSDRNDYYPHVLLTEYLDGVARGRTDISAGKIVLSDDAVSGSTILTNSGLTFSAMVGNAMKIMQIGMAGGKAVIRLDDMYDYNSAPSKCVYSDNGVLKIKS